MPARFAIVVFPGTWSDVDWYHAITGPLGADAEYVFHKQTDLSGFDAVVLPGGFSYGDYLRPGAIAHLSPVMSSVIEFANAGGPVIGSCNGFQVLCESRLLPGALMRNQSLQFRCQPQHLLVERAVAPFTSVVRAGDVLSIPVSHGDGNYFADPETLKSMEANGQIALRYCDARGQVTDAANPNGSLANIAGVTNEAGNVLGLMPHPERVVEAELGGTDGLVFLRSMLEALHEKAGA
ncbi:MAG: phosphoribosylformylglycinamidine synthase subunit PurQ [Chloroflexi bacterium]|nr:phosphoribosylformylglycinamidine synthase subunit PurQ [Chloroflexota bacterium]